MELDCYDCIWLSDLMGSWASTTAASLFPPPALALKGGGLILLAFKAAAAAVLITDLLLPVLGMTFWPEAWFEPWLKETSWGSVLSDTLYSCYYWCLNPAPEVLRAALNVSYDISGGGSSATLISFFGLPGCYCFAG